MEEIMNNKLDDYYDDNDNSYGYIKISELLDKLNTKNIDVTLRSKLLEEKYSKNNKLTKGKSFKIDFLRERLMFYRGMDVEKHDIEPSIMRLYGGLLYYTINNESLYCKSMFDLEFMKDGINENVSLKLLARMQHYGYGSRLIDVTFNEFVAIYMASYSKYLDTGKVIEFAYKGNTSLNIYTNTLSRFHYSSKLSDDIIYNLKVMNNISGLDKSIPSLPKSYTSEPVAVIDRTIFKGFSETYDMRYNSQDGAFICILNELVFNTSHNVGILDNTYLKTKKLKHRNICKFDKLSILFLLAKFGITNATIYPDSDFSNSANKIINKIRLLTNRIDKINNFNNSMNAYAETNWKYSKLNNSDKLNIEQLTGKYISYRGVLQFLLIDYVNILTFRDTVKTSLDVVKIKDFNNAVTILMRHSKESMFKYLFI